MGQLPNYPSLRPGCCAFEEDGFLILRSTQGAFRIEPARRQSMQRVLAKLDGTHDFPALLGEEPVEDAFYALHTLSAMADAEQLADGPLRRGSEYGCNNTRPIGLGGITAILPEPGFVSSALGERLRAFGAEVREGNSPVMGGAVLLVSPDGPDLRRLEEINSSSLKSGIVWVPVLPFGDAIVVGPLIRPGFSACFRCFELRWLGISPTIALERAYFNHLRRGGWEQRRLTRAEDADDFADQAATTVARCLADPESRDHVTLIRRGSVSVAILEPHPQCDVCATASAQPSAPNDAHWWEPALPITDLHRVISPLAGFCGMASIVLLPQSTPPRSLCDSLEVVVARFALPKPGQVDGEQDNLCHGSAENKEDALTIAIVEALERYSGLAPAPRGISANYASVAEHAVLPTNLPLYSTAQYAQRDFPFQPFDAERTIRWTWGYNLTRQKPVLVPAAATWYGEDDDLLSETSSGVAAHSSRGLALLNGALELLERDAFMIHWLHRLSPPLFDPASLDHRPCTALIRCVEQRGYTVRVADLTTDLHVPVCLAVAVREDGEKPALLVGAGASLDQATALLRSLRELSSAAIHATDLWRLKPPLQPEEVLRLEDHARAYEHPEWLPRASFLWTSTRRASFKGSELPRRPFEDLAALIALLEQHGLDLIGVEITSADVARYAVRVVRAIVPGLQPIGFGRHLRLGGGRLYDAPVRMGYREVPPRENDLYTIPHCFP
jgi:bacteriocin biosynthesis cyclodehydratase domain-containing protein